MKHFKLLFLLTMLLCMEGLNVSAHDIAVKNGDGKTIYYIYFNNNTELSVTFQGTDYDSYDNEYNGDIVIPSSVTYNKKTYSVTRIERRAFSGCTGLTTVNIPNSVKTIDMAVFYGCTGLTEVHIPKGVTEIWGAAFWGCTNLTTVTIPSTVEYFFMGPVFGGCNNLTTVTVRKTTPITISEDEFPNRANATLIVPEGCVEKYKAADYWKEFKTILEISTDDITFSDEKVKAICVTNWDIDKDGELNKDEASAVKNLGTVFYGNTTITSFNELKYFTGLTTIESSAFRGCSGLTSVTIPNSVTSIGNYAFNGSGLTSVTIPGSVTRIGICAFQNCSGLTAITIPNSVTSIGNSVFRGCSSLTSVTIPNSVTTIGDSVFYKCSGLTSITIPNSVTSIGNSVFRGCSSLTSVTIPNGVTSIGGGVFYDCTGLTSVTIPNSVTTIGDSVFYKCSGLTSITIPNSVTSIRNSVFRGCSSLTSVTIPKGVTEIWGGAFWGCTNLTTVTIPNSVKSIGNYAFHDCSGLKKVIVNDIAAWCGVFLGNYFSNPLKYAHHLYSDEDTEITELIIPNGVTSIMSDTFADCTGLTSVTIPNSVTTIGDSVFYKCSGLTSITIPNSVTSIGDYGFAGCSLLTTITIPNSVRQIGEGAFSGCSNLRNVVSLIQSPAAIPDNAFSKGTYTYGTLYVPVGTMARYMIRDGWKKFVYMEEGEYSSVNDMKTSTTEASRYTLNGRRAATSQRGLNIIKMSDGSTKKVMVK